MDALTKMDDHAGKGGQLLDLFPNKSPPPALRPWRMKNHQDWIPSSTIWVPCENVPCFSTGTQNERAYIFCFLRSRVPVKYVRSRMPTRSENTRITGTWERGSARSSLNFTVDCHEDN